MGLLKWLFSVNPTWRSSLMHPVTYRPPSSAEAPYKPPQESCLAPEEYRYSGTRAAKRHNPTTLIIDPNLPSEPVRLLEYKMHKEATTYKNPGEYFNVIYYK